MDTFFGCDITEPRLGNTDTPALEEILQAVGFLKPEPSPFPLVRIGGCRDGAYLLPDDLDGITACFSPGVFNRKDFEDELAHSHSIRSHMCDYSSDPSRFRTPLIEDMQTFDKKWLDTENTDKALTLDSWVNSLYPEGDDDLLLQMDIEGAEYRNILASSDRTLARFRIIVMELHGLDKLGSATVLKQVIYPCLKKIAAQFTCVHAHPNNCRPVWTVPTTDIAVPRVLEVTFLRRDRLQAAEGRAPLPVLVPHPLDVVNTKNPPSFLHESWLPAPRSVESRMKILEDKLAHYETNWGPALQGLGDQTEGLLNLSELANRCHAEAATSDPPLGPDALVDETSLSDVAAQKQFRLSRPLARSQRSSIVAERSPFFFHTALDFRQYMTIDLEQPCLLFHLILKNRVDKCQERARFLHYTVHDQPEPDLTRGLPVWTTPHFLRSGEFQSETPLLGARGRFFTIFSPVKTALHLSLLKLLGKPAGA